MQEKITQEMKTKNDYQTNSCFCFFFKKQKTRIIIKHSIVFCFKKGRNEKRKTWNKK